MWLSKQWKGLRKKKKTSPGVVSLIVSVKEKNNGEETQQNKLTKDRVG